LIEQILASHPDVVGGGELDFFQAAISNAGLATLASPGRLAEPTEEQIHQIGSGYLQRLSMLAVARAGRVLRVTDKMPDNFRHIGLIHMALPNARIIHTCRDPLDTCLSCFSMLFAKLPFTYDLGELGRRYEAYARLMQHWRRALPEGVMLDVHYEQIVADPEPQVRRILAHCQLEWHNNCLRFHENSRPVRTASVVQVRQPLYHTSVGRWRPAPHLLSPLLTGFAAHGATPMIRALSGAGGLVSAIRAHGPKVFSVLTGE
jgi:hypothetical protein